MSSEDWRLPSVWKRTGITSPFPSQTTTKPWRNYGSKYRWNTSTTTGSLKTPWESSCAVSMTWTSTSWRRGWRNELLTRKRSTRSSATTWTGITLTNHTWSTSTSGQPRSKSFRAFVLYFIILSSGNRTSMSTARLRSVLPAWLSDTGQKLLFAKSLLQLWRGSRYVRLRSRGLTRRNVYTQK